MTKNLKTSVRLALNDQLREAFSLLRRTKYPFMKEDEVLKLAFCELYAQENIPSSKITTLSSILARLRSKNPDFGKEWLKKNNTQEENLDVDLFCDMILDLLVK